MGKASGWYHSPYTAEEELAHLRQQIEEAEAELFEREAELVDLRADLYVFRLEYDTRVGRAAAELEAVEAQLKHCQERVSQYRTWGPDGPPDTETGEPYVPVEEQFRRAWYQTETPPRPRPAEPVDAATEARIKKLYRQLCRRFHPDLAQGPAEKAWRTELMTAINAAYAARSLVELQALAETPDRSPAVEADVDGAGAEHRRLAALRDKLQQIERRLREVEQEIRGLMNSPEMELSLDIKLARRRGRDLLAEMAADIENQLARKRVELDLTLAYMKELGIAS